MKHLVLLLTVVLALPLSAFGNNGGQSQASTAANSPASRAQTDLDPYVTWQVTWMHDQEKLARDLSIKFWLRWQEPAFLTIAAEEQSHMDEMRSVIERLDLKPLTFTDTDGEFGDDRHSDAFSELMSQGEQSLLDAYIAAAYLEEWDIQEFMASIDGTNDETLIDTYARLLASAREHLRMLDSRILALGSDYQSQILSQAEVDQICSNVQASSGPAFTLNAGLNDAWYYPLQPGQGFFVVVYPESRTVFVGWLTFDTELPGGSTVTYLGDAGQRWLVAHGPYEGMQASLGIESVSGGRFDATTPRPVEEVIGQMTLQFEDCAHGSLRYDLGSIYRGGVIPIQRIASENVVQCEALTGLSE